MIAILMAFLWRLSGAGVKPFGALIPITAGFYAMIKTGHWLIGLLVGLATWGAGSLPITIFGNGVKNKFPWGFIWIWVLGYIYGLPCVLIHGWSGLLFALIPCAAFGLGTTLSNLEASSKIFVWEFVEGITGAAIGIALGGYFKAL